MPGAGRAWGRLLAALTLGAATFVVLFTIRVVLESKAAYESAKTHLDGNDTPSALADLESAVKAYAPGNPYSEAAAKQISLIAKAYRMRGENPASLRAWEVLRRSILATRHFAQPYSNLLEDAEASIETMSSSEDPSSSTSPTTRISRPDDPSPFLSLSISAGLLLWIGGALIVLSTKKHEKTKATPLGWLISTAGLATWLLASWIA